MIAALVIAAVTSLEVHVTPHFDNALPVTRLAFLLSQFRLQTADGRWVELPDQYAFVDVMQNRLSFNLENIPADSYRQLQFTVGLDEKTNRADPSQWPADHPLNPVLNSLHWSWQGGYVFFALEGHYDGDRGYSLHLAKSPNQVTVTLPVTSNIALDVRTLFDWLHFTTGNSATHSRDGDELAAKFRANIARAFSAAPAHPPVGATSRSRPVALIAGNAHLYHFRVPTGFPIPQVPIDNPLTEEGVALGKRLFHETRLSRDNSISCASCHDPAKAFTDSPRRYSLGVDHQVGGRNAMPLFNLAWKKRFFWDGRASSLREQVLMPIQDKREMCESLINVVAKLTGYETDFERAFGSREINPDRIARALEQFVLTLTSSDSRFDRALKREAELTDEEERGFELFMTEYDPRRGLTGADCFHCHGGPLFSDFRFLDNGLAAGQFAVPSLRNVARTGPYMHDGRFKTLEEVVEHYSTGVKRSPTLDPNLAKHPDGGVPLSPDDKRALVAFLITLTDSRFYQEQATALLK